ncbi:DNA circulation family protein [Enterobacter sp. 638]|uniref:DNA circulation family protein n=1 Tax=Enterobacter sp. (strain 638) TaxID=399742 RepID=A0A9J9GFK4_ENT38|nr:DNA circulation family protein [Enterobacter sp. 638]
MGEATMTWKERLQDASFRGVPFKVKSEGASIGRRVETHEYPNRDKPYTEDLGKVTFRPDITAYIIGDDCFEQLKRAHILTGKSRSACDINNCASYILKVALERKEQVNENEANFYFFAKGDSQNNIIVIIAEIKCISQIGKYLIIPYQLQISQ